MVVNPSMRRFLARHHTSDVEATLADVESVRGTTLAQRGQMVADACRLGMQIALGSPSPERVLAWREPPPENYLTTIAAIRAKHPDWKFSAASAAHLAAPPPTPEAE